MISSEEWDDLALKKIKSKYKQGMYTTQVTRFSR